METKQCLCIKIPEGCNVVIDRFKIIKALFLLNKSTVYALKVISQQFNNYTWLITFNDNFDSDLLLGRHLQIDGFQFELEEVVDPNKFIMVGYKVLWLPHNYPQSKLSSFFTGKGKKIERCEEEMIKINDPELPDNLKISSGNFIVKVLYDLEKCPKPIETSIYTVDNVKFFVKKIGEAQKCLKCGQTGHIRRNCPLSKLKCDNCKKNGHSIEQCSMALRIRNEDEQHPDEFDESEDNINHTFSKTSYGNAHKRTYDQKSSPLSDESIVMTGKYRKTEENDEENDNLTIDGIQRSIQQSNKNSKTENSVKEPSSKGTNGPLQNKQSQEKNQNLAKNSKNSK